MFAKPGNQSRCISEALVDLVIPVYDEATILEQSV